MPIARPPVSTEISDVLVVRIPFAEAAEPIAKGMAVAMIDSGRTKVYVLCGALEADNAKAFTGFASSDFLVGENHPIITGRGSRVEPLLEGGGPLVPEELLYLSLTPGYVTHTAPLASGVVNTPIGHAVSTTEMVLKTDARVVIP